MSLEIKHFYEFTDYRLNLAERVLLRENKPVSITPKAFHLLKVLVENHGRIVEKEKLMQEIWADCVVEEGNLTFTVRTLRKILGDEAGNPRFIETVPRRGYRFIAEVKENVEETAPSVIAAVAKPSPPASNTQLKRAYLSAALLILVAASAVTGSWFLRKIYAFAPQTTPILSAPFKSERFSSSGNVGLAVISPNGKYVAYVDETSGRYGIWVRQLETSENIQIIPPSEDYYFGMVFSHDGNSLYFVRKEQDDKSQPALYRVMAFGGVPVKIVEKTEGWISVSPDDKQISFVRCERTDNDYCSLYAADVDGKNERKILTRARPFRIGDNQFSPDGKSIAFAAGQSWNGSNDFRLTQVNLETGAESEIAAKSFFNIKSLKWLPDGDSLLFTASEALDGKYKIWQVSSATGEIEPLTKDAANYNALSIDKNAERIIATQVGNNFRLYLSSFDNPYNHKAITAARKMTFASHNKMIYAAEDGDLWTINADGGEQRQLTNNPFRDFCPVVSPDGRYIFFTSNRSGANQVWRMNIDGSNQIQLTTKEGGYPHFISPDGKWIYYESGVTQTLWKISSQGGEPVKAVDRKMYLPVLSPDGSLAAYFFRDNGLKIGVVSLAEDKQIKVLNYAEGKSQAVKIAWSNDNRTLNFVTNTDSKNSLWQQSLDEEKPRFIADLGDEKINDFTVAPNGDGFAFVRGRWTHDAILIDGLK